MGLLYHGGRSLPHALMMLVPEPWEQLPEMDPARRAFYDFHAGLVEQWDGPAALGFSDGVIAGATLDRNGLRPLRYAITSDGLFIAGSEAGTVEVDQSTVIEKGRLGPGQMIAVDTRRGIVLRNDLLKSEVSTRQPYADWLAAGRVQLDIPDDDPGPAMPAAASNGSPVRAKPDQATVALQRACGYTAEDLRLIVNPMAEGQEPTWSMGDDAPLAVLSERPRPLHAFFRQRFAQVTNPAIDSLRERKVMALDSFIGPTRQPPRRICRPGSSAPALEHRHRRRHDAGHQGAHRRRRRRGHDLDTVRDSGRGRERRFLAPRSAKRSSESPARQKLPSVTGPAFWSFPTVASTKATRRSPPYWPPAPSITP